MHTIFAVRAVEFYLLIMDNWTVGEWLICDRNKRNAIVIELRLMRRDTYATLYHPENRSKLYASVKLLQDHGWHKLSA